MLPAYVYTLLNGARKEKNRIIFQMLQIMIINNNSKCRGMCQMHEISRRETDSKQKSGWSSNWDTTISKVKTLLNQILCILVKLTRDLRPHFQRVLNFFLDTYFLTTSSDLGFMVLTLWQFGISFFSADHNHSTQHLPNNTSHFRNPCRNHFTISHQHNTYFTPAGHIRNSGLWFCITLLMVPSLGWALKRAKHYVELNLRQSNLYNLGSQFIFSSCRKIQNWRSRNQRPLLQNVSQGPKCQKKMQTLLPVSRNPCEHPCWDTEGCFPGTDTRRSWHTGPSWAILSTLNCRSFNIRPNWTGTKRQCRKKVWSTPHQGEGLCQPWRRTQEKTK